MSLLFFEGPAGSGKTTRLMKELAATLAARPLLPGERVLALTRMHGSRRRLHERLESVPGLARRFEAITMDSLAWRMLTRWRSRSRELFGTVDTDSFAESCRRAGALIAEPLVQRWLAKAYPVVVVDEMQDCKEGQLAMVQGLSEAACCLVAADAFQDLDGETTSPAVEWARTCGTVVTLDANHRTSVSGLLAAAQALRSGQALGAGDGFEVRGAPVANVGAGIVSLQITKWRTRGGVVVLSPVGATRAPFVRDLVSRVQSAPPMGKFKNLGPHQIPWELSSGDEKDALFASLNLPSDSSASIRADNLPLNDLPWHGRALKEWCERQRRVSGRTEFSAAEILQQASNAHLRGRAGRRSYGRRFFSTTVHQAKNREFDYVIVLWPHQIQGTPARQRRLLYNAITRAKLGALVVAQDESRLAAPPFREGDTMPRPSAKPRKPRRRRPGSTIP